MRVLGKRKANLGQVTDTDIRLLRIFLTVADHGGLAAAETALGIGRSSISTYVADLETRLGFRLCHRGPGGFALTDRGREVYEAARTLMASVADFHASLSHLHDDVRGPLNVAVMDNLVWDDKLDIVDLFATIAPDLADVDLNLMILAPREVEHAVADGSADVGIAAVVSEATGLARAPLFTERSFLFCGANHPWFGLPDKNITSTMLKEARYVRKAHMRDDRFADTNEALTQQVVAENVEAIAIMVLTGRYIGFLPECYARQWVRRGEMRAIAPTRFHADFEIAILTSQTSRASAAQTLLIDRLQSRFPKNGAAAPKMITPVGA